MIANLLAHNLIFIEVVDDRSVSALKLLDILLQLHNTDVRVANIETCKAFSCFVGGGGCDYKRHHNLSDIVENTYRINLF